MSKSALFTNRFPDSKIKKTWLTKLRVVVVFGWCLPMLDSMLMGPFGAELLRP